MLSTSLILTLGASAMAATVQRDLAVWTLQGCYTDISTSRTLAGASTAGANMTVEACQAFCSSGGYNLAGVEYGSECCSLPISRLVFLFDIWTDCDHALQAPSTIASAASCNMPCSGNKAEVCGAGNFINVYWNGQPFPVAPPLVGTWGLQGCFADNVNSRALPHQQIISGMTIEKCTAACKSKRLQRRRTRVWSRMLVQLPASFDSTAK
ncbi:hypothetical protein MIND_00768200 [Mycena indigotica]|uniref:WSC domain-containing protein n=1 Tax=Mycena indigotica TaxID=2126181 RepID=A0A8H6SN07_9AGAR|nr:uncharacterized protein MIND_00768200 [Mycena indigotica]KAF7302018.1 hypothetical protein MIND_00768200 [Mycena indigotica]